MKIAINSLITLAAGILLLMSSCSRNRDSIHPIENLPGTSVLEWNEIAFQAYDGPLYENSLAASRINVITQLAIHDAINAIYPKYAKYAFTGSDSSADPLAALASAAHTVLLKEIPLKKNFLDSCLNQSLNKIADGDARQRGIVLGKQAAEAVLAARNNDGSVGELIGAIPPSTTPGVYQPVPPFGFLFAPFWEDVRVFGIQQKNQFRPGPPPAINSEVYTTDFEEVKQTGKLGSTTRTPDQTAYAKFWYEFSEAGWNRIARTVAADKQLSLFETARLLALVDMALADAYIAGWDAKMYYNFWRPFTAVRAAANDGNDQTVEDLTWESAEPTPPVQDYPSTHSALGNAAATVLARILGDNTAFSFSSFTALPAGSQRSFTSFSQAADENADSRVRAGLHFRFSCVAGQELGNKIGNWIADNQLKSYK